jgi:hypothetical protein
LRELFVPGVVSPSMRRRQSSRVKSSEFQFGIRYLVYSCDNKFGQDGNNMNKEFSLK